MALTRAQLLSGNGAQGTVLAGQVQGVTQGTGVSIAANGQISVDASTVVGLVRLNNPLAFNAYVWPNVDGAVGEFLQTDGSGNLIWANATGYAVVTVSNIQPAPADEGELWFDCNTGELKVFQSCVAPGGWTPVTNTGLPVLPANTTAAPAFSGGTGTIGNPYTLAATTVAAGSGVQVVNTVSVTGLTPNQFVPITDLNSFANGGRFSFTNNYADALGVLQFDVVFLDEPPSPIGTVYSASIRIGNSSAYATAGITITAPVAPYVPQTVPTAPATATPNAVIPAGTTADRQTAPAVATGEMRYNTTIGDMEVYDGAAWVIIPSSSTGNFVPETVPTAGDPSAVIPAGTTANRQTAPAPAAGYLRFNTTDGGMEFFDGTNWVSIANVSATTTFGLGLNVTGTLVKVSIDTADTPPTAGALIGEAIDGSMYWDNEYGAFFIRYNDGNNTQWVQTTGADTNGGPLVFPGAPAAGATYAAPNGVTYTFDGTKGVWTQPIGGGGGGGVTSWSGGTTGLTPAAATTGVVTLGGVLGVANGGTGQTTAQGAIDALLPSQGGNAGKYLTTDGTNTAWSATPLNGPASLAEAAAGTITNKYSSPETAVPKDAAGMTGAALIPGGNDAARPGTPVEGMLRYNNQTAPAVMEYYDGSNWVALSTGGGGLSNVIYGTANCPPLGITITHAAVDLAKSYIIMNVMQQTDTQPGGALIFSRTATSFRVVTNGSLGNQFSYFLVY